jgi:hypothetical protein
MMLNPGQLNPNQAGFGGWGTGNQGGLGFGAPMLSAFGNAGLGFGGQQLGQHLGMAGYGMQGQGQGAIEDIADDIADRVASEIADQAATGAAALFQAQVPQAGGASLGGLNVKRWLNAARVTDSVHDTIKQNTHQICRQVVGHLLNILQAQWAGGGQQFGQHQQGNLGFGGLGAQGMAAFGGQQFGGQQFGQPNLGQYGFGQQNPGLGQQNIAQLAPVVAAILGVLQSQGQGLGHHHGGHARFN